MKAMVIVSSSRLRSMAVKSLDGREIGRRAKSRRQYGSNDDQRQNEDVILTLQRHLARNDEYIAEDGRYLR